MKNGFLFGLIAVALCGCSPALKTQQSKLETDEKVVCQTTTPTGSNFPRRVCTTESQRERQQKNSQATLDQAGIPPQEPSSF